MLKLLPPPGAFLTPPRMARLGSCCGQTWLNIRHKQL